MKPTPYVASLRVYEPLSSFDRADQDRWSQLTVKTPTGIDEQDQALRRVIASQLLPIKPDGAHYLEINDKK